MVVVQRFGSGHRVLISGGAGFVPSHLVDSLIARGCAVVAVDNFVTGSKENVAHLADNPLFTLIEGDVSEGLPDHHPAMTERFDAILHMASPASPKDFTTMPIEILRVGSTATLHLLERAAADGARFIMASTSEAYGDPLVHPQAETYWGNVNPVGLRSVYDEAKRFAEAATMAYYRYRGVDAGIVRIFNTYGPRMRPDDGRAVPTFITQALHNEPITVHGSGAQTRSICYVSDLVRGILLMLDSTEVGPINCGDEHEVSMRELAELVVHYTGSESTVTFTPRLADDPEMRRPDLTLARTRLGYEPEITPEDGLRRTIEDFRRRAV
jgi:dTDP-glucose 4,6-dehydratase